VICKGRTTGRLGFCCCFVGKSAVAARVRGASDIGTKKCYSHMSISNQTRRCLIIPLPSCEVPTGGLYLSVSTAAVYTQKTMALTAILDHVIGLWWILEEFIELPTRMNLQGHLRLSATDIGVALSSTTCVYFTVAENNIFRLPSINSFSALVSSIWRLSYSSAVRMAISTGE
jgi:hypothetical protein